MERRSLLLQLSVTFALILALWYEIPKSTLDIPLLCAVVSLLVVAQLRASSQTPRDKVKYSLGSAVSIAIWANYGILSAMLIQGPVHFFSRLKRKSTLRSSWFSLCQFMLSSFVGGSVFRLLGGTFGTLHPEHLLPLGLGALCYLLTNYGLVTAYVASSRQVSWSYVVKNEDIRVFFNDAIAVFSGVVYAIFVSFYGTPGFLIFAGLLLFFSLMLRLGTRHSMERERRESVEKGLLVDPKTNLYNYKFLNQWLATIDETPVAVLFIDLDNFKLLNDKHGHEFGDRVLMQVASLLQERVGEKGSVIRYGGEEFVVLLPSCSSEDALHIAEDLRKHLVRESKPSITASFGVAAFPDCAKDRRELLHRADYCMYKAKALGKNRSYVWKKDEEFYRGDEGVRRGEGELGV